MGMDRLALLGLICGTLVLLGACADDNDLGKRCFIAVEGDLLLTDNAWDNPDCRSRLCLKQSGYKCPEGTTICADSPEDQEKLQSMCTRSCETHADCQPSSDNVNGCQAYVCQQRDPVSTIPVPCHCACLDFIRDADGAPLTQAAFDATDLACPAP